MTLDTRKGQTRRKNKKFVPRLIITTDKGIRYIPTGKLWEYPLFIGEVVVHNIGPEPLLVEFLHESKGYVFVFYDKKLGMVAKARVPRRHAYYVLQELISRQGNIPKGGIVSKKRLSEMLTTSNMTIYRK